MDREKTALLVIDVQQALLWDGPYDGDGVVTRINDLANACREKGIEVIYVRHDGGSGDELECGTAGWQIAEGLAPKQGERIFDKYVNSAFRDTGLRAFLEERGVTTLILCGMQTEYCVDTTCKVAFEYGYEILIPKECFTTFDTKEMTAEGLNRFYAGIWHNRFGKVVPITELEQML